jgi:hypothetical protein
MSYDVETVFEHDGKLCVVTEIYGWHRCGYVGVPETSPLYGKEYDDNITGLEINMNDVVFGKQSLWAILAWDGETKSLEIIIDVHGGITYSGSGASDYPIDAGTPTWWFGFVCGHYDDVYNPKLKEFVIAECKSMAEQLTVIEKMLIKEA